MKNNFYISNKEKILNGEIISTDLLTGEKQILPSSLDFQNQPLPLKIDNIFYEKINQRPELIVFGAGHVGKALGEIGNLLDFDLIYVDNRQELLTLTNLPFAKALLCLEYNEIATVPFSKNSYVVIVTQNHNGDLEVLQQVIHKDLPYIGMMGSKRKTLRVMSALEAQGIEKEKLAFVHAPIGLAIGAQTPSELAISILGEIIPIKNSKANIIFPKALIDFMFNPSQNYVLAKITNRIASAPREVGATMLITSTDILGTIGGGKLEATVIEKARALLERNNWNPDFNHELISFGLNEHKDNSLDMWCGGEVEIYFEIGGLT